MKMKPIMKSPIPTNINLWWNFGSMLMTCMMIQILSGTFLSMMYNPNIKMAFKSINEMKQNANFGWIIQYIHMNTASMMFMCMFIHIGRNMYYKTYMNKKTWMSGIMIMMMMMMTAFLGYILPWGQMSLWGATVITNLLSTIPYIGKSTVKWIWGGFSISNATINRFYSLHFMMPMMTTAMIALHITSLHEQKSSNPMGTNSNMMKIPFHPYFTIKDLMTMNMMISMITLTVMIKPMMFSDPENFNMANSMSTPNKIQPEWYFLFAYAILRSIPNKTGGVMALLMSMMILMTLPISKSKFQSNKFKMENKLTFWLFTNTFMTLTWIGSMPVEPPFMMIGQMMTMTYFLYFILNPLMTK